MATWQVQRAKAKLSELIEATEHGPQIITKHGTEQAVVLSIAEYRALTAQRPNFRDYLLSGPVVDDLDIERNPDTGRDVAL